jgi:hypothetical protein
VNDWTFAAEMNLALQLLMLLEKRVSILKQVKAPGETWTNLHKMGVIISVTSLVSWSRPYLLVNKCERKICSPTQRLTLLNPSRFLERHSQKPICTWTKTTLTVPGLLVPVLYALLLLDSSVKSPWPTTRLARPGYIISLKWACLITGPDCEAESSAESVAESSTHSVTESRISQLPEFECRLCDFDFLSAQFCGSVECQLCD